MIRKLEMAIRRLMFRIARLTHAFFCSVLLVQIAGHYFWKPEHRHSEEGVMCDMEMKAHRDGEDPLPCVSTSDLAYLVSLFYCYEPVIDWYNRKAEKTLEVFPPGHQWKDGEPQPEDKEGTIGKQYWTEPAVGKEPPKRHYYEKKPDPVVSV